MKHNTIKKLLPFYYFLVCIFGLTQLYAESVINSNVIPSREPVYIQMQRTADYNGQESSIHPVWYGMNKQKKMSKKEKIDLFRTICNQMGVTENSKIPKKDSSFCRIVTYNVHFWRNPYGGWGKKNSIDFYRMFHIIYRLQPDILILQEVGGAQQDMALEFDAECKKQGYHYTACCSTSEHGPEAPGHLYNCIISKYPFKDNPIKKQFTVNPDPSIKTQNSEQRCFVGTQIQLPNNKIVSVYGTHFEVRPIISKNGQKQQSFTPENARKAQLEELLKFIKDNDKNENIIIGADFNGFRKQDLQAYSISNRSLWTIFEQNWKDLLNEMGIPANLFHLADKEPPSFALDYIASQGYRESFAVSGFNPPQFTTWTGTRIDFLFLSPSWNLPLEGSYVFYNWASDHIPVIMDIKL